MKVVVLNGTEVLGCTHKMKEVFLKSLGGTNEVKEFYFPKDCNAFCTGCKACFLKDMSVCPHRAFTVPIWESVKVADLIIVTSPSYVFGPTAQIKAVLDHFATKWMAHSPEKEVFFKQAVIITNAIGAGMKDAIKIIKNSLGFWGISSIFTIKQALFDAKWELINEKRKKKIYANCNKVSKKIAKRAGRVKVSLKTKFLFSMFRMAHKMINKSELKKGHCETNDHKYWQEHGWLNKARPWKK